MRAFFHALHGAGWQLWLAGRVRSACVSKWTAAAAQAAMATSVATCLAALPLAAAGQEPSDRERMASQIAADVQHLENEGRLLRRVVAYIRPTVVHIDAERPEGERRTAEETGSGVIVRLKGQDYVLTNRHVIRNARVNKIRIRTADGRLLYPTKVWSDRGTDVAVLAMNAPSLVPAKIGDSAEAELGDYVLAVGSPFGLSHSVTFGIISAKGRRDLQLGSETVSYQDFIQTDAAINPGNSGGPLMNLRGEVIGLNTAIASNSGGNDGIGFSIPINMAMAVAQQLIERGVVVRGYLGVHLDSRFNEETARRLGLDRVTGARVSQVTANSPAAIARVLVDDVILEFDGKAIQDDNQLVNLVSLAGVGRTVPVIIHRRGQRMSVSITLTDRERFEASDR
ncbi:MAG: Periplasmic serine endoprotease DegP precursor [Planctomycetota bacterium]|jgi:serine protease Do